MAFQWAFKELLGKEILPTNPPGRVVRAEQMIRFRLDQTGIELESDVNLMQVADGEERPENPVPRKMFFNKPFLIALREPGAKSPYFAAWISNFEVLEIDAKEEIKK